MIDAAGPQFGEFTGNCRMSVIVKQVRGPGRNFDSTSSSHTHVDSMKISKELSDEVYTPYLIESVIREMESQGLFSSVKEWKKDSSGRYIANGVNIVGSDLSYTDFTARFVEFIFCT